MANPNPVASFKENNTAGYLPRRRHSEKLVYSKLKDYGVVF